MPLASDILDESNISERFDISVSRPTRFPNGVTISQGVLFDAFRQALAGAAIAPLVDQDGKVLSAEVSIAPDGVAVVSMDGKAFRFENSGLLASSIDKRNEFLEMAIAFHTLSQSEADRLGALSAKLDFSDDDFHEINDALLASQEAFAASLAPKVRSRKVALGDLLPAQASYWNQLATPLNDSTSLAEFIAAELRAQREFLLAGDARRAMKSISLSFSAPALVPIERFRTLDSETVLAMLEEATQFSDHFGLVGSFELCGDWFPRDARFGPIGDRLLDKLFSNLDRLKETCEIFSAGFTLAIARLHQHQELRRKPPFWRRLTAAAHASLLARAFEQSSIDPSSLFKWAMGVSGKAYYLSICLDLVREPSWRADWLNPKMLVPGAFGRAAAVVRRLPDGIAREEWTKRIDDARKSIGDSEIFAGYPDISESGPRKPPLLSEMGELTAPCKAFIDAPVVDNALVAGPIFYSFGIPAECVAPMVKLIADFRQTGMRWEDNAVQATMVLATYVAIQSGNVALADAIAEFMIENAGTLSAERASEIMFRLVECAGADGDRDNARKILARRLETFTLFLPATHLFDVHDSLTILQNLDVELAPLIGKAVAAARIGAKAA
ncbi:MAG: hypothetical protein K2Y71_00495 [Xanthobacteraceae bacterium]|nr:hypothetical protein [Xanthobacteraceae bacterium]